MKSKPGKKSNSKKAISQEDEMKKIGIRIRELRIAKGYTSYEIFAYEHDISRAQLGRYENGQDLRMSSLLRVIEALDTTLKDFFGEGFD